MSKLRKILGLGPSNKEILEVIRDIDRGNSARMDAFEERLSSFQGGLKTEFEKAIDSRTENMRAFIGLHTKMQRWVREILNASGVTAVEPKEQ